MRARWHALHEDLLRSTTTLRFQHAFERIRDGDPHLGRFCDPAALLDHLHDPGGSPDDKNSQLTTLLRAVQRTGPDSTTAHTLLLLALWPGLDAVYRRLLRYFLNDPDHLASELTARFGVAIATLDLSRVSRIAATLLRNIERDIGRDLKRSWALPEDAAEDVAAVGRSSSAFAIPDTYDGDAALAMLGRRLRREIGEDTGLVLAVTIAGFSQKEVSAQLGLSHDAVRKRYQRALSRVKADFFEPAVPNGQPGGRFDDVGPVRPAPSPGAEP